MSSGQYDNHFPTAIQSLGVNNILPMTDSPSRSPYTIYDVERANFGRSRNGCRRRERPDVPQREDYQ